MFYSAREGNVQVNGIKMSYVEFGNGQKPFEVLPGLGDGLKTFQGQAKNMALYYRTEKSATRFLRTYPSTHRIPRGIL